MALSKPSWSSDQPRRGGSQSRLLLLYCNPTSLKDRKERGTSLSIINVGFMYFSHVLWWHLSDVSCHPAPASDQRNWAGPTPEAAGTTCGGAHAVPPAQPGSELNSEALLQTLWIWEPCRRLWSYHHSLWFTVPASSVTSYLRGLDFHNILYWEESSPLLGSTNLYGLLILSLGTLLLSPLHWSPMRLEIPLYPRLSFSCSKVFRPP